jgi:hypothetical protein
MSPITAISFGVHQWGLPLRIVTGCNSSGSGSASIGFEKSSPNKFACAWFIPVVLLKSLYCVNMQSVTF